jgi:hypothetical protein
LDVLTVTPEISAEDGIRQIRQVIGSWFSDESISPQQALASVANVLLGTRLDTNESKGSTPA